VWKYVWIAVFAAMIFAAPVAILLGRSRERRAVSKLEASLRKGGLGQARRQVQFSDHAALPTPVARYFRKVLADGQPLIKSATMRQTGELRTSITSSTWRRFTARQLVVPGAPGFVWYARIRVARGLHVDVLDSYVGGMGLGRVSFLSAIPIGCDSRSPELNSGELHRYLAEAVWYPTALLPQSGVRWSPIDAHAALATLTDNGTTVSLEFRFNDADEVVGIYTKGRFSRVDGTYRELPWEGHFSNYAPRFGVHVPGYAEVGWYERGEWQVVWKGETTEQSMEFER